MRSNVLLFVHVLVAMALLGGLLTTAVAGLAARGQGGGAGDSLRRLGWWSALLAAGAAVAVVALGEALASKEDIGDAGWLDASRVLTTLGLLAGGVLLAVLARFALRSPRLAGPVGWLAGALSLVAFAVAFLMTAKPV